MCRYYRTSYEMRIVSVYYTKIQYCHSDIIYLTATYTTAQVQYCITCAQFVFIFCYRSRVLPKGKYCAKTSPHFCKTDKIHFLIGKQSVVYFSFYPRIVRRCANRTILNTIRTIFNTMQEYTRNHDRILPFCTNFVFV